MGAPGCDDAPIIEVPAGTSRKRVTMVYPYYDNPEFFCEQIVRWQAWPDIVKYYTSLIVVDDGSPTAPAVEVMRLCRAPFEPRLFRIHVDVRWNWLAARNIGAHHATDDWLLLTDMDHVVHAATMNALQLGLHEDSMIYRFSRVESTGEVIHPHPNSWFMTREMFWVVGGYDEALSGYYGTDGEYRRRCAAAAPIGIMTNTLERHEHIGDASTLGYKRKQPEDARVKMIIRSRGPKWSPRVLSFKYDEVKL
jgi:hypothetical protein